MKTTPFNCALDNLSPESITRAAEILRTLAHPIRLKIIDVLNATRELPVCEITRYLDIAQSATSQHLNHMRRSGLLQAERRGKEMWYSISDFRPVALLNCICNCCNKNS